MAPDDEYIRYIDVQLECELKTFVFTCHKTCALLYQRVILWCLSSANHGFRYRRYRVTMQGRAAAEANSWFHYVTVELETIQRQTIFGGASHAAAASVASAKEVSFIQQLRLNYPSPRVQSFNVTIIRW